MLKKLAVGACQMSDATTGVTTSDDQCVYVLKTPLTSYLEHHTGGATGAAPKSIGA